MHRRSAEEAWIKINSAVDYFSLVNLQQNFRPRMRHFFEGTATAFHR
jgi:hypothetical protein